MRLQLSGVLVAIAVALAPGATPAQEAGVPPTRVRFDTMAYHDSDHTDIISPQLGAEVALDDRGGSASATVVVDLISAASVDVISEATPGFTEVREEVDLGVAKRLGGWLPGAHYRYSHEPDYLSHGGGVSVERSIGGADTTLVASLDVTHDLVGLHGTSFDSFSRTLMTYGGELSLTQVLGPRTVLRGVYSLTVQDGYLAKPYRYVPLFDAAGLAAAQADGQSLGLDNFSRYRLSDRPPENVPDLRIRHAIALRLLRYLPPLDGSLRVDYRFYADDWSITSQTLEVGLRAPVSSRWQLELASRSYYQTSAWFWRRAYEVAGAGQMPTYRSVDKDLASAFAETVTGRAAWSRGHFELDGDVSFKVDHFFDYLFLDNRLAIVAVLGARWSP